MAWLLFQFLIGILFDSYLLQQELLQRGLFVSIPYRYSIRLLRDNKHLAGLNLPQFQFLIGILFDSYFVSFHL